MWGNNSLTGKLHWPCCLNFHGLPSHCRFPLAVGFFDSVNALPSSSASFGLGSNESTCDTPPSMKQKMTFLARGAKCGAARASSDKIPASATRPNPWAEAASIPRRDRAVGHRPGHCPAESTNCGIAEDIPVGSGRCLYIERGKIEEAGIKIAPLWAAASSTDISGWARRGSNLA
jgi:hypothetical protein